MVYDAWNRLAAVYTDDGTAAGEKDDDDTLIAEYRYDGRHRRIAKIEPDAAHSGKYVRTDYYYSLGWQVVEERRDDDLASKDTVASTLKYQYVWGVRYVDAPVCRDEDTSGDGDCTDAKTDADPAQNTGDEHLYYTQDANFNVTALVDDYDGAVVERYMYSPYGEVTVLHGDRDSSGTDTSADEWSARTSNTFENAVLYCGYYQDSETGLYHVRNRYYHPPLGRWTSRDPIGYVDGMGLYEYVRSRPLRAIDAFGKAGLDIGAETELGNGPPSSTTNIGYDTGDVSVSGNLGPRGGDVDVEVPLFEWGFPSLSRWLLGMEGNDLSIKRSGKIKATVTLKPTIPLSQCSTAWSPTTQVLNAKLIKAWGVVPVGLHVSVGQKFGNALAIWTDLGYVEVLLATGVFADATIKGKYLAPGAAIQKAPWAPADSHLSSSCCYQVKVSGTVRHEFYIYKALYAAEAVPVVVAAVKAAPVVGPAIMAKWAALFGTGAGARGLVPQGG